MKNIVFEVDAEGKAKEIDEAIDARKGLDERTRRFYRECRNFLKEDVNLEELNLDEEEKIDFFDVNSVKKRFYDYLSEINELTFDITRLSQTNGNDHKEQQNRKVFDQMNRLDKTRQQYTIKMDVFFAQYLRLLGTSSSEIWEKLEPTPGIDNDTKRQFNDLIEKITADALEYKIKAEESNARLNRTSKLTAFLTAAALIAGTYLGYKFAPERRIEIPGPVQYRDRLVPGPERIVKVPGPERIVKVPGPERRIEIPGPVQYRDRLVPGPERIVTVEKIVEKEVILYRQIPGRTRETPQEGYFTKEITVNEDGQLLFQGKPYTGTGIEIKVEEYQLQGIIRIMGKMPVIAKSATAIEEKHLNLTPEVYENLMGMFEGQKLKEEYDLSITISPVYHNGELLEKRGQVYAHVTFNANRPLDNRGNHGFNKLMLMMLPNLDAKLRRKTEEFKKKIMTKPYGGKE